MLETAPTEGQGRARLSHPTPTSHGAGLAPGRTGIEADHLLALPTPSTGRGALPSEDNPLPKDAGASWWELAGSMGTNGTLGDPLSADSGHAPSQGMIMPAHRPSWGTRG